jgi:hypothetical protein
LTPSCSEKLEVPEQARSFPRSAAASDARASSAWVGFTLCATRFDTDVLVYRLLTLLAMFAVASLAGAVPDTRKS